VLVARPGCPGEPPRYTFRGLDLYTLLGTVTRGILCRPEGRVSHSRSKLRPGSTARAYAPQGRAPAIADAARRWSGSKSGSAHRPLAPARKRGASHRTRRHGLSAAEQIRHHCDPTEPSQAWFRQG
jgi:hypothetical protein